MTAREMQRSISPGSTEYGERQVLEEGLASVAGGGDTGSSGGGSVPAPTHPARGNPLSDLIAGNINPDSQEPVTAGLSVGPGDGPSRAPSAINSDIGMKLQAVAKHAASPVLRRLAQDRLRRLHRKGS